jgi:hypothetical protein
VQRPVFLASAGSEGATAIMVAARKSKGAKTAAPFFSPNLDLESPIFVVSLAMCLIALTTIAFRDLPALSRSKR